MNIGIVGAGTLGSAIGARLASLGHGITFASTGDSALRAADSVPGAQAADVTSSVASSDVVVLAVPYAAVEAALADAGNLQGRILWSCVNALKPDASGLAVGFTTSAAERVAEHASGARVVAALPPFADQISSGDLEIGGRLPTVFCCSDDAGAKNVVADLVRELGIHAVDAGPLIMSRLVEPAMMLVIALAYADTPPRRVGLSLLEAVAE